LRYHVDPLFDHVRLTRFRYCGVLPPIIHPCVMIYEVFAMPVLHNTMFAPDTKLLELVTPTVADVIGAPGGPINLLGPVGPVQPVVPVRPEGPCGPWTPW
jgi:hypothetical protein